MLISRAAGVCSKVHIPGESRVVRIINSLGFQSRLSTRSSVSFYEVRSSQTLNCNLSLCEHIPVHSRHEDLDQMRTLKKLRCPGKPIFLQQKWRFYLLSDFIIRNIWSDTYRGSDKIPETGTIGEDRVRFEEVCRAALIQSFIKLHIRQDVFLSMLSFGFVDYHTFVHPSVGRI